MTNVIARLRKFQLTVFIMFGINSLPTFADNFDDWAFHGFIAQGVIKAGDSNFVNEDGDISFDLTEIGLNFSYQWRPDLRVAGQAVYLNGGNRYEEGGRLDYLFLDWGVFNEADWRMNLYLGRVKSRHGLYTSTRDVPHTRSSIILPQSVYYDIFRDLILSNDGIALFYNRETRIGEFDFSWSYGSAPISGNESELLFSKFAKGNLELDYIHQVSIFFRPKDSSFQYGISVLDAGFDYQASPMEPFFDSNGNAQRFMLNLLYSGEKWDFSAELIQERKVADGFVSPLHHEDGKGQGFYTQGRYLFDDRLTIMLRYDRFDVNKDDRNGSKLEQRTGGFVLAYFGYMYDTTAGLTYCFGNNWRLQAEYHWLEGAGRLSPAAISDVQVNNSKYHNMGHLTDVLVLTQ